MDDLTSRIAGLTAEKRALLARWLQRNEREEAALPTIPLQRDRGFWPLSFAQERLWFIQRWAPDSNFYHGHMALSLDGALAAACLARAVDEVFRRHEVLRATFSEVDGEPVQTVGPFLPPYLEFADLSSLPPELRDEEGRRISRGQAERPFDLEREPALRALLLRTGVSEHELLLTMHHIATDAWSWGVLLHEIATLYRSWVAGLPSPLPGLAIQYADYAAWQRESLGGEALESEIAYWREALDGIPPVLELPTDRPRLAEPSLRGASEPFLVPRGVAQRLLALAGQPGVTPFMAFLAAFQGLLGRLTGQTDVVVGTPVAGRHHPSTHDLIGVFINLLVLRARVGDDPLFTVLLDRVRRTAVEAYAHQDLPFERLVEELRPSRDLGRQPLFQVLLVFQEAAPERPVIPGLELSIREAASTAARYDWALTLTPGPEGFTGSLDYATDLFDRATIQRFLGHFSVWIAALAEAPERRLSDLPLLTEAERHQLVEWNATAVTWPREATLDTLFAAQAVREPDAVAVVCEGESLTYGELASRAGRLAMQLRRLGVGPEVRVGICAERSPYLVVGLLAILQSGGTYVPLDPSYPAERLAFLLDDSCAPVLLVQQRLRTLPGKRKDVAILGLDAPETGAADAGPVPSGRCPGPDNLAYVIYTSGSTGRPKGAMNTHRGIVNRLLWMQETYGLTPEDRVLQKTPFSFDVSVWEFFWPLLVGARLVLARPEGHKDPAYLVRLIREEGITHLHFVPSMLQAFLAAEGVEECRSLRRVVTSGEALATDLAARFFARLGQCGAELLNLYGPTEAAVEVTAYTCRPGDELRPIPIGRPIANCTLHIMDAFGREAPVGVKGELLLGGVQLARGYLGRPELTAERFVPDPIGTTPGARLYRTGDLVRYRPDGAVEFLGRIDQQVKVRGFRIELEEIEMALAAHPDVREVVVAARGQGLEQRLVAYVVPAAGNAVAIPGLRRHLAERLPEYMVPAAWVVLAALPLSPNGKVDRHALPEPSVERTSPAAAVRTLAEELIAQIWAEVLGLERVGGDESFFDLGGHSLLATQVVSRVRQAFGVEIPLRRFFQSPTVAGLAAALKSERGEAPPPIASRPRPEDIPLSFAQERLWFLHQLEPQSTAYNLPVALRLRGHLDEAALEACFGEIVRRHEALRTTFGMAEERPVQQITAPAGWRLPVTDLTALPDAAREGEAHRLAREEAGLPFDLAAEPLLRTWLLRLAQEERILLLDMHHIVSDGWSMGVLVREAVTLYTAATSGEPSPLLELAVQYADFALWQREWLSGDVLERQLAYWKGHLAGAPPVLDLPLDRPRPAVRTSDGGRRTASFSGSTLEALRSLCRRETAAPFMGLLAAFAALLRCYTGQEDLVIGAPIANRTRPEIEPLIGFFVNTLALRIDLSGDPDFRSLLARARNVALEAYAHQDLPFEKLIEELQPDRDRSRQPLVQGVLALENIPLRPVGLPGLTIHPLGQEEPPAKFDLSLFLEDGLSVFAEYNRALFDAPTIDRLLGHFERLLAASVAHPDRRLSHLTPLGEAERQQLLREWNDTAAPVSDLTVPELFARQAARNPEALALVCGPERWSYRNLDERSHRLAERLRRNGVGPEVVVALHLERSADLVAAMLAVLKAGGAYLPLDPSYPTERLAFFLSDARCGLLLTRRRMTSIPGACRRLFVQEEPPAGTGAGGAASVTRVNPEGLAYVIYTSGSTGRPKGVAVPHAGLANLVGWHLSAYPLSTGDRASQLAGIAFDASVWEIWPPLVAGACLHLADEETRTDPQQLVGWLASEGITSAFAATPMAEALLQASWPGGTALRFLLTGGDALRRRPPAGLGFRLVNHYGPTENSVVATAGMVEPAVSDSAVLAYPPSIGTPIGNVRVYVTDRNQELALPGAAGELLVGGGSLARGYLYRPDLTAERFVPDPWGGEPGGRLYRTGDLVRLLLRGDLLFLGRIDHQVKIRGFRIELGEIESVLQQHGGVREAVVLPREDHRGETRLVAYFVPCPEAVPTGAELRLFLQRQLPDPMVPAFFMPLESLPVTANGKLDRAALPAPETDRSALERELVLPRTSAEQTLARIWSDVLGVSEIGVHDNFFKLGGHSLKAIQLATRLREALGTELPLRSLFDHPTIAELASVVAARAEPLAPVATQPILLLQPERLQEPFPLMDLQQAYWLGRRSDFELGDVSAHTYQELELIDLDVERFELAWQRLIDRHPMLRAVVLPDGRQRILETVPPFRIHQLLDLRERDPRQAEVEVESVRRRMAEHGPSFEEWPLFEVCISLLDEQRCRVHINLSLVLCDAISAHILTMELPRLYADPEAELPSIDLSFRDYVMALAVFDQSETVARSLAYWTDRVRTLPPAPALPLAARGGRGRRSEFVRRAWAVPAATWSRIKEHAGKAGVTPTVAVLTAYAHVLATWSRSRRFTLNLLYFNRRPLHPHVGRVVGNFSSTILLEVDLSAPASFERHAQRIQDRLWQDMEHGWVSGVRVLRELNRLQGATGRPVMPVVFTSDMGLVQEEPAPPAGEGGLRGNYTSGALQTPQVWIDHQVSEWAGQLLFNWDAMEDLFPPGLVEAMFGAYCNLFERLAEEEAWDAGSLPLVPQDQLALMASNATAAPIPEGRLQDPFVEQARRLPDAPAVLAASRRLTYGELARQAAALRHRLHQLGAEPNTLVAIVMQKGWEQVASALAILEAGAAYLPIDPALPRERLWHLLERGEVRIALTQPWIDRALEWPRGLLRIPVEPCGEEDSRRDHPVAPHAPEDLAYVIFTSGSTGLPKGVMIDHRGALNTVVDINRRFAVGPEDRVLSLSALSFDLSVYDLFGLLAAGGAIVLPEPAALREPARWVELIETERVTIWNSVPALMEMLVDYLEGRGERMPASLRLVLLSGDWIPVSLPDRIHRLGSGLQVISLGGATEASIWSILYPIETVDPSWASIPYGRAMVNQSWQVLDEILAPRPVWVVGDLYIGGVGLAHGYWKDEEKSRASFLIHPVTGERLYRTGDLGRWLPDGNIEFLGREDLQVKIQGYRIELGEIEVVLASFPGLRAVVVAVVGEDRGSKRLVAYVVPAGEEPPGLVEELRAFLAAKLPSYMVPTSFVVMDSLPLSANGKVDRRALPDPGARAATSEAGTGLARDETELALVRIWEEVLGTAPISIHDSFFELGGHSLLAVQLLTRVQAALGQDLPLSALFEFPTVERLAVVLRRGGETASRRSVLVGIQPRGERPPFFCIHPVGGNVLCYAELARWLGTEQPFYGLQALEVDPEEEGLALERMAGIYLEAVRQVQPHGPYLLGGWSMGGILAYEMARQLQQAGEPVALVAMLDAALPDGGVTAVDDATLAAWFARDLGELVGRDLRIGAEELQGLGPDEQALRILEQARSEQVLPPDLGPPDLARHLAMFKRNFRALLAYVPQPYPGRLSLFAAEEGEGARAASFWQALAQEGAEIVTLPGNHYSLLRTPGLIQLVESLSEHLSRTSEATRPPFCKG